MVLLPLLIVSSSAIVFDAAKMGYNGRIKREKKSPAFMYPLNGMKQDCVNYQKLLAIYAVRSINSLVFILLDVAF